MAAANKGDGLRAPGVSASRLHRPAKAALRAHKPALGRLVSIEAGKIISEGRGEVQEMIDICDLALGQSRQLYGLTIATERPDHRNDGDVAPAGGHRDYHRLQLPRRSLGLERGARPRMRELMRLEAF
jgi:acyl-CoA reductase-like NAD-dependent aldehyde dehydrogenase